MAKLIFIAIISIIIFIAYTGIDVISEYDDVSKLRNQAFDLVIDPITKKILIYASESNLDEIINTTINKYNDEKWKFF